MFNLFFKLKKLKLFYKPFELKIQHRINRKKILKISIEYISCYK